MSRGSGRISHTGLRLTNPFTSWRRMKGGGRRSGPGATR
jgi:hypothetical protein